MPRGCRRSAGISPHNRRACSRPSSACPPAAPGGHSRRSVGPLHTLAVMIPRARKTASAWGGLRPHGGFSEMCRGQPARFQFAPNGHIFAGRARDGAAGGGMQSHLSGWIIFPPAHVNAGSLASRLRNTDNSQTNPLKRNLCRGWPETAEAKRLLARPSVAGWPPACWRAAFPPVRHVEAPTW
jgi:hypothetical protein